MCMAALCDELNCAESPAKSTIQRIKQKNQREQTPKHHCNGRNNSRNDETNEGRKTKK